MYVHNFRRRLSLPRNISKCDTSIKQLFSLFRLASSPTVVITLSHHHEVDQHRRIRSNHSFRSYIFYKDYLSYIVHLRGSIALERWVSLDTQTIFDLVRLVVRGIFCWTPNDDVKFLEGELVFLPSIGYRFQIVAFDERVDSKPTMYYRHLILEQLQQKVHSGSRSNCISGFRLHLLHQNICDSKEEGIKPVLSSNPPMFLNVNVWVDFPPN